MRKIKDVLRLKLDAKMSHQQIAAVLGISKGVVTKYVGLAAAAGLDKTTVQSLDETILERLLLVAPEHHRDHVQPEFGRLHQELRRKGMTLMLLWEEHRVDYAPVVLAERAVLVAVRALGLVLLPPQFRRHTPSAQFGLVYRPSLSLWRRLAGEQEHPARA